MTSPFAEHHPVLARGGRAFFFDFETQCDLDVKKTGAVPYAAHPSLRVLCMAYAWDDDEIFLETDPGEILKLLHEETEDPDVVFVAHNVEFERAILRHRGIETPPEKWIDTAAVARHAGLPGGLDDLGAYFGHEKDADGHRVMLKLTKPRRPSKANPDRFWTPETKPDDFARMYAYCEQDVRVTRACLELMPPMPERERRIFAATLRMNDRGLPIDRESVHLMRKERDSARDEVSGAIEIKHGFTLGQVAKVAEACGLPDVKKNTLRDFLKEAPPGPAREIAEARQLFAKTSTNKLEAFWLRSALDGRVHDGVIYGGAERTLRWSGFGIQPQNLPRGMGEKQTLAFWLLLNGYFGLAYGHERLLVLAEMLRGVITGPLTVGDLSQIEARLLAWISGDEDMLDLFARGEDPYRHMAAKIYRVALEAVTAEQRFLGKQAVLGAGYGLGAYGFCTMLDTTYDVQIPISEGQGVIDAYRANAPAVVRFWRRIDKAMVRGRAVQGWVEIVPNLRLRWSTDTTFEIELPSGRLLRYRDVERSESGQWSAFGRLPTGGYGRVKLYGGKLCGHIVQSIARDVIAHALLALEARGLPLILTVHDELVAEGEHIEAMREVLQTPPAWLIDFPLACDVFSDARYRK